MEETLKVINCLVADGIIENYAIGGAVGLLFYTEPALTFDLDIFCFFKNSGILISLTPVYDYLIKKGYQPDGEYVRIEGIDVQFLPPTTPLVEEAMGSALQKNLNDVPTRVFQYEHLLAIMTQTGRAKDRARVTVALESRKPDLQVLNEILSRHHLLQQWAKLTE